MFDKIKLNMFIPVYGWKSHINHVFLKFMFDKVLLKFMFDIVKLNKSIPVYAWKSHIKHFFKGYGW